MDTESRLIRREKYLQAKRAEEVKRKEDERAFLRQEWQNDQRKHLSHCGYADADVDQLIQSEPLTDCINWDGHEWWGDELPYCCRVIKDEFALGYNLKDLVLSGETHRLSPEKSIASLTRDANEMHRLLRRWNMVNPYPAKVLQPFAEGQAVATREATPAHTFTGTGTIGIPPEMLDFATHTLSPEEWSHPQHPFLVIQLAYTRRFTQSWACDFAVMTLSNVTAQARHYPLSREIQQRTGLSTGDTVHARLVQLDPVLVADRGVGVHLEYIPTVRDESKGQVSEARLTQCLTAALEQSYILVKGQWLSLVDDFGQQWIYRVKRLFSASERPVHAVSIYNTRVALKLDLLPSVEPLPTAAHVLDHWTTM